MNPFINAIDEIDVDKLEDTKPSNPFLDVIDDVDAEISSSDILDKNPKLLDVMDYVDKENDTWAEATIGATTKGFLELGKGLMGLTNRFAKMIEDQVETYQWTTYDEKKSHADNMLALAKSKEEHKSNILNQVVEMFDLGSKQAMINIQKAIDKHSDWFVEPAENYQELFTDPKKLIGGVIEMFPRMFATGLFTAAGRPDVGSMLIFAGEKQALYEGILNAGGSEEEAMVASDVGGFINTVLENISLKQGLKLFRSARDFIGLAATKKLLAKGVVGQSITKQLATSAITEVFTEMTQGTVQDLIQSYTTDTPIEGGLAGAVDRRLQEAILSFASVLLIGGAPVTLVKGIEAITGIKQVENPNLLTDKEAVDVVNQSLIETGVIKDKEQINPAKNINKRQQEVVKIGKKGDISIVYYEAPEGSALDNYNGFYLPKSPKTFYINKNNTDPLTSVFSHEFLHNLRRENEEAYNNIANAVIETAQGFPELQMELQKRGVNINILEEEAVADILGELGTTREFVKKLLNIDANAVVRMLDKVKDFIDKVAYGNKPYFVGNYITNLKDIEQNIMAAMKEKTIAVAPSTAPNEQVLFSRKAEEIFAKAEKPTGESLMAQNAWISPTGKGIVFDRPTMHEDVAKSEGSTVEDFLREGVMRVVNYEGLLGLEMKTPPTNEQFNFIRDYLEMHPDTHTMIMELMGENVPPIDIEMARKPANAVNQLKTAIKNQILASRKWAPPQWTLKSRELLSLKDKNGNLLIGKRIKIDQLHGLFKKFGIKEDEINKTGLGTLILQKELEGVQFIERAEIEKVLDGAMSRNQIVEYSSLKSNKVVEWVRDLADLIDNWKKSTFESIRKEHQANRSYLWTHEETKFDYPIPFALNVIRNITFSCSHLEGFDRLRFKNLLFEYISNLTENILYDEYPEDHNKFIPEDASTITFVIPDFTITFYYTKDSYSPILDKASFENSNFAGYVVQSVPSLVFEREFNTSSMTEAATDLALWIDRNIKKTEIYDNGVLKAYLVGRKGKYYAARIGLGDINVAGMSHKFLLELDLENKDLFEAKKAMQDFERTFIRMLEIRRDNQILNSDARISDNQLLNTTEKLVLGSDFRQQYKMWTFPGLDKDSYNEIIFTIDGMPMYPSPHWEEYDNVFAHARFSVRDELVLLGDEKMEPIRAFFIEEIQSDWESEYRDQERTANRDDIERNVPKPPYKDWVGLVLKRMVEEAINNGFDFIAFPDGRSIIELNTSTTRMNIDKIEYVYRISRDSYLIAGIKDEEVKITQEVFPNNLERVLGNHIATTIKNRVAQSMENRNEFFDKNEIVGVISERDISIGGQMHRLLYDTLIPKFIKSYLKTNIGKFYTNIDSFAEQSNYQEDIISGYIFKIPEDFAKAIKEKGQPIFSRKYPNMPKLVGKTPTKQAIHLATGFTKPAKKQIIDTYKELKDKLRGESRTAKKAYNQAMQDARATIKSILSAAKFSDEIRTQTAQLINKWLPKEERGQWLLRVAKIKKVDDVYNVIDAVREAIDKAEKRAAIRTLKNTIRNIKDKYGSRGDPAAKMLKEFGDPMRNILSSFEISGRTPATTVKINDLIDFANQVIATSTSPVLKTQAQKMLDEFRDKRGKTISLSLLSTEAIETLIDEISWLDYENQWSQRTIADEKSRKMEEVIDNLIKSIVERPDDVEEPEKIGKKVSDATKKYIEIGHSNLETLCNTINGGADADFSSWQNRLTNFASEIYNKINRGVKSQYEIRVMFRNLMRGILEKYNITEKEMAEYEKDNIEVVLGGANRKLSMSQLLSIYMHTRNSHNLEALLRDGLRRKLTKIKNITQKELVKALEKIPDNLKSMAEEFGSLLFDSAFRDVINQTSLKIDGFEIAKIDNYYPAIRFITKKSVGRTGQLMQSTIEGLGLLKERISTARPLKVNSFFDVVYSTAKNVSAYYGLAAPLRDVKAILNNDTLIESLEDTGFNKHLSSIREMIERIEDNSAEYDIAEKGLAKLTGKFAKSVFSLNIKLWVRQYISVQFLTAFVDGRHLKALRAVYSKKILEQVKSQSPELLARIEGHRYDRDIGSAIMSAEKLQYFFGVEPFDNKMLIGMSYFDTMAILDIWRVATSEIKEAYPNLKEDSAEFINLRRDRAEFLVRKTQPTWHVKDRSLIGSTPKSFTRALTMFSSQAEKIVMMGINAANVYAKTGDKSRFVKVLSSLAVNATLLTLYNAAFAAIVYRQRTGIWDFILNLFGNITGLFYGGKYVWEAISRAIKRYFKQPVFGEVIEIPPLRVVETAFSALGDYAVAARAFIDNEPNWQKKAFDAVDNTLETVALLTGKPYIAPKQIYKGLSRYGLVPDVYNVKEKTGKLKRRKRPSRRTR